MVSRKSHFVRRDQVNNNNNNKSNMTEDPFALIERAVASRSTEAETTDKDVSESVTREPLSSTKAGSTTTRPFCDDNGLQSFFQSSSKAASKRMTTTTTAAAAAAATVESDLTKNMPDGNAKSPPMTFSPPPSDSLSELAKQLRLLQTKNDAHVLEIARLERQLQLMADLSTVSVGDVAQALQVACAAQAPSEVQATMASLRNQLQLAQLQLQQQQQQQQTPTTRRHEIADLELRIGELEELEHQQRQELNVLYQDLSEQSASWIRLKAHYEEQQVVLDQYKKRENGLATGAATDASGADASSSDGDDHDNDADDDMRAEEQRLENSEQLLREELELASDFGGLIKSSSPSFYQCDEETAAMNVEQQVQQSQLAILQKQLEETEKAHKLKQAQLKARNFVLEENMQDLEQQMSSLYTAFNIASQDLDQEQQARRALESNLHAADEQVAQYIDNESTSSTATPPSPTAGPRSDASFSPPRQSPARASPAAPRPYPPSLSSTSSSHGRPFSPQSSSPQRPSYTSSMTASPPRRELVKQGRLMIRTSGLRRKMWKEKNAALYLSATHFYLVLSNLGGDSPSSKTYTAAAGSAELQAYSKQPFAFTFLVAPGEMTSTVLYLATTNEIDFDDWMTVLGRLSSHPDRDERIEESVDTWGDSIGDGLDVASREAADLERAIWLSTHEQHVL